MYEKIRQIQTGCAEIPTRTSVIVMRSMIERGRSAERIPTGIESDSHRTAPPKTSEAVTGASLLMISRTGSRFTNDCPSDPWRTSSQTNRRYCFQIGSSGGGKGVGAGASGGGG